MARYHRVGVLLRAALDEHERRQGKVSITQLAKNQLKMSSAAALSQWLNGLRAPPAGRIVELAGLFYEHSASERERFKKDVANAVAQCNAEAKDPYEEITDVDGRAINWGMLRYGVFARLRDDGRTPDGFLAELFQRFLAFAALPHSATSQAREIPFGDVAEELQTTNIDLLVGQMATVDRALRQEFFVTPIRIGLNAICHKDFSIWQPDLSEAALCDALQINGSKEVRQKLLFLIQEEEVGGLYVKRALDGKFKALPFGNHAAYARALESHEARDRVPVAVVDEYTCTGIVNEMGGQGRFVFPVVGMPTAVMLPVYAVGMTVNRRHRQWIDYLQRGLGLFLAADSQYLGRRYAALWDELRAELTTSYIAAGMTPTAAQAAAASSADSILSLGDADPTVVPPPWLPIVHTANKIVHPHKSVAPPRP